MIQNNQMSIKKHVLSYIYSVQESAVIIKIFSCYKNVYKNVLILWCNYILFIHLDKYDIESRYSYCFEETTEHKKIL
jgi:hypothetical protein